MAFKLVVSDDIQFRVHFELTDGAAARAFTAVLSAKRCPGSELDAKLNAPGRKVTDFLDGQGLTLKAWGESGSPFVDDAGQPVLAEQYGALAALLGIPGMPALVMSEYMVANGARGKLGN